MKKLTSVLLCIVFMLTLSACNKKNTQTQNVTADPTTQAENVTPVDGTIIGTWTCGNFGNDHYFTFDEKGNAVVTWGSYSVQGDYDYDEEYDEYDFEIELAEDIVFLYDIYKIKFNEDTMLLYNEDTSYLFKRAQLPEFNITTPDDISVSKDLVGKWRCTDTYDQYTFNADTTAYYMHLEYLYKVSFKVESDDKKITFYSLDSQGNLQVNEIEYKLENGKLKLGDNTYEKVEN